MTWTTAKAELRKLISDDSTDKRTIKKECIGLVNGTNKQFITFDYRRTTDFTAVNPFPLGVFVDGVSVAVTLDDPASGVFELAVAPALNKKVEATYFSQWFLDANLDQYLKDSALFCRAADVDTISPQLRHAALKYAAAEAYQFLSLFWARQTSEAFKLNDAMEKDRFALVKSYADMAKTFRSEATVVRDDFYERSGTQKSPSWNFTNRGVR